MDLARHRTKGARSNVPRSKSGSKKLILPDVRSKTPLTTRSSLKSVSLESYMNAKSAVLNDAKSSGILNDAKSVNLNDANGFVGQSAASVNFSDAANFGLLNFGNFGLKSETSNFRRSANMSRASSGISVGSRALSSLGWHRRNTLDLMSRDSKSRQSAVSRLDSALSSGDAEDSNMYVLVMDRATGSGVMHYMLVATQSPRPHLVPQAHPLPMPRLQDIINFRAVALNNNLYVMGGRHMQSGAVLGHCYRYDPEEHQWRREASMLRGRVRFTATVLDGCIYVCGGELRDGRVTASVECYDPVLGAWADVAGMPTPRLDHATCAVPGGLFVSGGTSERRRGGSHAFWFYDAVCDEWTEARGCGALPSIRHKHIMLHHRDTIFCFAGLTITREAQQYKEVECERSQRFSLDKCHVGATLTGLWDTRDVPGLTWPRVHAGHVTIGEHVYLIGGQHAATKQTIPVVEYYNTRRNRWTDAFSLGDRDDAHHPSGNPSGTPRTSPRVIPSATPSSSGFRDVDCVLLSVPKANPHFSHLGLAFSEKWVLW